MTISVQQFRADYPEFSGSTQYPPSQIQYWLNFGYSVLSAGRWGRQLDFGVSMYVAHNLTLEARAQAEAVNGTIPGGQVGILSSKSVDKVSASYDTTGASEPGAGHWNLSVYGVRFIRLAKLFGAGPVQIGIGASPALSGPGWSGLNLLQ